MKLYFNSIVYLLQFVAFELRAVFEEKGEDSVESFLLSDKESWPRPNPNFFSVYGQGEDMLWKCLADGDKLYLEPLYAVIERLSTQRSILADFMAGGLTCTESDGLWTARHDDGRLFATVPSLDSLQQMVEAMGYDTLIFPDEDKKVQPEGENQPATSSAIHAELCDLYNRIGIDRPENHERILDFVMDDVKETADPVRWHSGDVAIAFRRFLESEK